MTVMWCVGENSVWHSDCQLPRCGVRCYWWVVHLVLLSVICTSSSLCLCVCMSHSRYCIYSQTTVQCIISTRHIICHCVSQLLHSTVAVFSQQMWLRGVKLKYLENVCVCTQRRVQRCRRCWLRWQDRRQFLMSSSVDNTSVSVDSLSVYLLHTQWYTEWRHNSCNKPYSID